MAHIIPHPRAAASVVVQKNGPGRYPKMVLKLWRFRRDRDWAKHKAELKRMEIESFRRAIAATELAKHQLSYDLAKAIQDAAKGQS